MSNRSAFYNTYRPVQLKHVIGQEIPIKILIKSVEKDYFHHSYLFAGQHGTGKTSTARILASILTCEERQSKQINVCGKCPACLSSHNGNGSIDIYELDGASNSKIENTRAVIESSRYSPQQFKNKVFIIDECHRLSSAAMTSLLKTLEEPPGTSTFILCTTDVSKVPKEIISRCQTLYFRPVSAGIIAKYLSRLFGSIKIEIEDSAIECIAKSCKGSVRDAIDLSQQVSMLYNSSKILEKDVSQLIGTLGREFIYNLIKMIGEKDLIGAFEILFQVVDSNVNLRTLCDEMAEVFRNLMLSEISSRFTDNLLPSERILTESLKKLFSVNDLAKLLNHFEEAEKCFSANINNRWIIEALIVNIINR